MSEVIEHPSIPPTKRIFEFEDGTVTIESRDGWPLLAYDAVAWLEKVKFEILWAIREDE